MTVKKIEGHLQTLSDGCIYCHPYGPHNVLALLKTMLEKCHHFTLTDALVTIQTINLSVPGSELKK